MGFTFTVTTDATGGVPVYFTDGRLTDTAGRPIFTDRTFDDEMDAEFWLLNDLFAQFVGAYIAKKSRSHSPTIDVLSFYGVEPTLDSWLEINGVTDTFDAELLEVIPTVEFRDEYEERLRLHSEYETKWQARSK
jgi:hypothetical protein